MFVNCKQSNVFSLQKSYFFHFYPTDLVNTKTTIPLMVGEQRLIYTSRGRVSVFLYHYSPPLLGIVVYWLLTADAGVKQRKQNILKNEPNPDNSP